MLKRFIVLVGFSLFAAGCSSPSSVVTTSSTGSAGLANPASVNCEKVGGTLQIKDGPIGQYGLCFFEDNRACEEWALMRGDCPVGGVKTTGYDTDAQRYCAWIGGQTIASPGANCTLKNGKACSADAVYQGTCQ